MDESTAISVECKLMAAIARAVAASDSTNPGWQVCIKSPDGETLVRVTLAQYGEVSALAMELRSEGYQLEILSSEHMTCDFVLKPCER